MRNGVVVAVVFLSACSSPLDARTVSGPSGSRLDVPAGALKTPAELALTTATTGFPTLPSAAGATVFALTPHGQTFEVPVTVTFPAAAGQTRLLTAQPGGQWAPVAGARRVGDSLVAEVSHFSFFVTAASTRPTRAIVGDGWAVRELDLADGGVRTLVEGMPEQSFITAVAVDEQGRVYWLDNVTDALTRMEADGSGRQVLYTSPDAFSNPEGLAVDSAHGVMFWAEGGKVMRAQLDGTGAAPFIAAASNAYATSVALDRLGSFLYWTDNGTDTINRVAYDGSSRVVLRSSPNIFANPRALAVDVAAGVMFWGEGFGLMSAPLDGGVVTSVSAGTVDFTTVTGIAVDPDALQLYWTDNGTDALTRANYDGTGQVRVYSSPVWSPAGPLDAGPAAGNATNPQGVALK
ncbi:MAG: hypothetical protein Q8L48_20745 [Archangium sp.]|nr:hypothetical protein [Archangium sp.]